MSEKTVAAVSTPPGEGGISVIRISGDDAVTVADRCFKSFSGKKLKDIKGYTALYGEVVFDNSVIDDAVALVFRAPKSFTGEDTVEISVHGGKLIARKTLRAILESGAYLAPNGEFTKRAFLNGKFDLTKAESIIEIINAKNETALKISQSAKNGKISAEIDDITAKLLELDAAVSVYSDYPDEEIDNLNPAEFSKTLNFISNRLDNLLRTYDAGKVIREGVECSIVGRPNVGKSSLMNALCKNERSIVTEIAGTTRDVIESTVVLDDITLLLYDTAGIHQTDDIVEKAGVERSVERLNNSLIVLAVFDASLPLTGDDRKIISDLPENAVIVLNKTDLGNVLDICDFGGRKTVTISANNGIGLENLSKAICETVNAGSISGDEAVLISERQRDCVQRAYDSIMYAKNSMDNGVTLDAVGICIDDCLSALLELVGKRVTSEVADEVFRRFCVGK